ncbi:MAG: transposase [Pyrinomonadaceae bacterium]|nr:transposase [Pyrinomonadaceae bacterium]
MAQKLTQIYLHIIFSTKNRFDLIPANLEPELFAYPGGITRNRGSRLIGAGGTANHIHLLISISKNEKLPDLVGTLKRESSEWLKTKRRFEISGQDGYGAFSVGPTQIGKIKEYIADQKIHHSSKGFEDEFRYFLEKYNMEYEKKYVCD